MGSFYHHQSIRLFEKDKLNFYTNMSSWRLHGSPKKKRRLMFRRKRTLDQSIEIDYKNPETLRRFITDRGKIIPRRISGATAKNNNVQSVLQLKELVT